MEDGKGSFSGEDGKTGREVLAEKTGRREGKF
jgi:hypothetical protein